LVVADFTPGPIDEIDLDKNLIVFASARMF
jgi:hypothetical protein